MRSLVIERDASLFGVEDRAGVVVRAGAFGRSLPRGEEVKMLLRHVDTGKNAQWTLLREDGRGLFVRELVSEASVAGLAALGFVEAGKLTGCRLDLSRGTGPSA